MKKLILSISLLASINAFAQTDTSTSPITVLLPVKAIVIYSWYLSQQPNWSDRKAPDQIIGLIGSGTQPDSVVTVTMQAGKLAFFAIQLYADHYGALVTLNRSVFNNLPAITGYTALFTQIAAKATASGPQKDAASYVQNRFNAYSYAMASLYNDMFNGGVNFARLP